MMRILALVLLLIVLGVPCGAQTLADSLYQVAQRAYEDGNFDAAEFAALRGLRAAAAMDDLEKLKFHLVLGFVYVARDQREAAERAFTEVLAVNPALELDPVQTSPKILEVFRAARSAYLARLASEPAVFRMPQADVRIAASWRSLVLPGWGQFYKQQDTKGATFAAAQLLSLVALIFFESEVQRREKDYLSIKDYGNPLIEDRYNEYRRAYRVRNVVACVALGIYVLNYFDALYSPVARSAKKR